MAMDDWQRDSDMIFTQITTGDFDDFAIAQRAVCVIYAPDMTISRGGIAHALKRLERHYAQENRIHDNR
jgi:hypothetical protein